MQNKRELWHRRSSQKVVSLLPFLSIMIKPLILGKNFVFVTYACVLIKQNVFPISDTRADDLFALIHCDIWGAYNVASSSSAYYFLTIVDDFSCAVWVYTMSVKSEVKKLIQFFCAMVQTQFNKKAKILRSDNGLEFTCLRKFYDINGILH